MKKMGDNDNREAELPVGERPDDTINRIILSLRSSSNDNPASQDMFRQGDNRALFVTMVHTSKRQSPPPPPLRHEDYKEEFEALQLLTQYIVPAKLAHHQWRRPGSSCMTVRDHEIEKLKNYTRFEIHSKTQNSNCLYNFPLPSYRQVTSYKAFLGLTYLAHSCLFYSL